MTTKDQTINCDYFMCKAESLAHKIEPHIIFNLVPFH
jgi:hypothetical protein